MIVEGETLYFIRNRGFSTVTCIDIMPYVRSLHINMTGVVQ